MFFRKAKRIKELEKWLNEYYEENQRDKKDCREAISLLKYKHHHKECEYRYNELYMISAMLAEGKERIEFSDKHLYEAENYALDYSTDCHERNWIALKKR